MHRRLVLSCLAAAIALPGLAAAEPTVAIYGPGGVALGGTDPVSYFTDGRPVPGSPVNALMWMGATWLFASVDNRDLFEADPHRYTPAFGGYCSYAVSRGYIASTDPEAFAIKDGRLYLLHSIEVRGQWTRDMADNIHRARANWPQIRD